MVELIHDDIHGSRIDGGFRALMVIDADGFRQLRKRVPQHLADGRIAHGGQDDLRLHADTRDGLHRLMENDGKSVCAPRECGISGMHLIRHDGQRERDAHLFIDVLGVQIAPCIIDDDGEASGHLPANVFFRRQDGCRFGRQCFFGAAIRTGFTLAGLGRCCFCGLRLLYGGRSRRRFPLTRDCALCPCGRSKSLDRFFRCFRLQLFSACDLRDDTADAEDFLRRLCLSRLIPFHALCLPVSFRDFCIFQLLLIVRFGFDDDGFIDDILDLFFHALGRPLVFLRDKPLHFLVIENMTDRRHLIRIVRRRCIRHPVCHICRAHHEADKEEENQKWMSIALFYCSFSSDCHENLLWEMVISFRLYGFSIKVQGFGFKSQGSGFARGACRPLIACERGSAGSTSSEGSSGGAAHHHMEAPWSIDGGDARRWHFSR